MFIIRHRVFHAILRNRSFVKKTWLQCDVFNMVVKLDKVPFEDALNMTGFGIFNWLSFLLCASTIVGMAFEIFSVSYLVPASACELLTTSSQQGLIAGVPLIGIIATSHFWGYLADTRGRRHVLKISLTVTFISGSLAAFSPNWIVFTCLKFCSSASVSSAVAVCTALMSESTPAKNRSTFVILTTSVFLIAQGIMAVLVIPILPLTFSYYIPYLDIHFNSWRLLDLIFAMPAAFGALGIALSYESPKYLLSIGEHEKAMSVLKGIFKMNSGKDADLYRVNSVVLDETVSGMVSGFWASLKVQTLPMLKLPLLKDTIVLSFLFIMVYIGINPFVIWLPYLLNAIMVSVEHGNEDFTLCDMIRYTKNNTVVDQPDGCTLNAFAMTLLCGINIIIALINMLTSSISRCVSRKIIFITLQILPSVTAICINLSTVWQFTAFGFMIYLNGVINFGTLTSYCVDAFPTNVKAMAICVTVMFGRGSAFVGINIFKNLLEINCELAFYLFGGITLIGGLVGFMLPSDKALADRKDTIKHEPTINT